MKNLHLGVVLLGIAALVSCNKGNVNTHAAKGSIEGYTRVNQGNYDKLTSNHTEGGILEEGFAKDESKEGTWLKYDKEGNLIGITSYMDGKINGPSIEMNNRGQITRKQYFLDDVPHGIYGDYKFGRATKEVNYKNGEMDGMYKEFYNNGELQRSINYKNGVMDGPMKYYNEEGGVTLEYSFKNGEKVGEGVMK
ncbi:MAG: hypothetical protein P8N29_07705 [Saprospiraceae bacterium]|jgi:antitoxin component YwqK of YwqJK toxin-antitoxin module|nr:hypothetical protein [Saprospiraceae bacterium]